MCWKYEDRYKGACFDQLFFDDILLERGIDTILKEDFGVEFDEGFDFRHAFFDFLSELHEKGLIKPKGE